VLSGIDFSGCQYGYIEKLELSQRLLKLRPKGAEHILGNVAWEHRIAVSAKRIENS
jgi:hypothetical protein